MALPVPSDLEDALAANPAARDRFWSLPPSARTNGSRWVERARLPRARRRRIAETVRRLAAAPPATAVEGESVAAVPLPRDDWERGCFGLALLAGLAAFLVWYTVYRDDNPKGHSTVGGHREGDRPEGRRHSLPVRGVPGEGGEADVEARATRCGEAARDRDRPEAEGEDDRAAGNAGDARRLERAARREDARRGRPCCRGREQGADRTES